MTLPAGSESKSNSFTSTYQSQIILLLEIWHSYYNSICRPMSLLSAYVRYNVLEDLVNQRQWSKLLGGTIKSLSNLY